MTPLNATPKEARKYEQNLTGRSAKPARKKQRKPGKVIIHVADDVKPETLAALASLAMRVMEMPEEELTEFIRKVRRI